MSSVGKPSGSENVQPPNILGDESGKSAKNSVGEMAQKSLSWVGATFKRIGTTQPLTIKELGAEFYTKLESAKSSSTKLEVLMDEYIGKVREDPKNASLVWVKTWIDSYGEACQKEDKTNEYEGSKVLPKILYEALLNNFSLVDFERAFTGSLDVAASYFNDKLELITDTEGLRALRSEYTKKIQEKPGNVSSEWVAKWMDSYGKACSKEGKINEYASSEGFDEPLADFEVFVKESIIDGEIPPNSMKDSISLAEEAQEVDFGSSLGVETDFNDKLELIKNAKGLNALMDAYSKKVEQDPSVVSLEWVSKWIDSYHQACMKEGKEFEFLGFSSVSNNVQLALVERFSPEQLEATVWKERA